MCEPMASSVLWDGQPGVFPDTRLHGHRLPDSAGMPKGIGGDVSNLFGSVSTPLFSFQPSAFSCQLRAGGDRGILPRARGRSN